MKKSIKEIMQMSKEDIERICWGDCETNRCLFERSWWKYREDGYCIKETFEKSEKWIEIDDQNIAREKENYQNNVKFFKNRQKRYKKLIEKIKKELEETND